MRHSTLLRAAMAALLVAPAAHASLSSFSLIAVGSLNGATDLAGLSGTLENGLSPNVLGGMGSGLAYAGSNTFLALPDRGPNATPYNSALDDTSSYISRFQTVHMTLQAATSGGLPYALTPTLSKTTLLYSPTALTYGSGAGLGVSDGTPAANAAGKYYFSGRSDNFDATKNSLNPNNGRLDPEGIRVSADGKSVFVSDEYGPYVYQFDRATGARLRSYALPADLAVNVLSAHGDDEINHANNPVGRVANKGMEGLAITPDGKTLYGVMQAPLEQDTNKVVRIVKIDVASGATTQYAYQLTTGTGVSEILAINDHELLLDERDGKGLGDGSKAAVKQLFKVDLAGAQVIADGSAGNLSAKAVSKTLFMDVVQKLGAAGITPANVPAKIEGMAFGEDLVDSGELFHTLWIANDNDFLPATAGPNNFYVFAIKAGDLASYQPQVVPVPATLWLLGSGLVGLAARRRRAVHAA